MKKIISKTLNIKDDEVLSVTLMLGAGFFMGIFLATYQVTAESLFINKLSNQLDKAFLISGILGIISTLLFSYLQNRIKFTALTISSVITIVLVSATIYFLYHKQNPLIHNYVLFGMFCLIGPMTAILLLCYWGVFGRLFNFKQSKRIIGWIDTGQLVAAILAYFIIPLTTSFFPDTSNYLIVCGISILLSLGCLIIISARFPLTKNNPREVDDTVIKETKFSKIFKDKYILLLGTFLIISMITYVLNQFSFQNLINKQYPDQRSLTNFLAFFNGAIYLISFVMQTFVNDKLMSNYGLKISLYILPIVVGVFSIITFLSGIIFGYDLQTSPTAFIFFFLFIALTRLFNGSLRDSLENPVFKLLFIPLDARYRFSIQAKIEGVVNETGRLFAGMLIFSFALIPFFSIIYIPILILGLVIAYIILANNLHGGYKAKIRSKLENNEFKQDKLEIGFTSIIQRLEIMLYNDVSKAVFSFKLLEKIDPTKISKWVNNMMGHSQPEVQDYAQRKMNEIKGLSVSDRYVIKIDKNLADDSNKRLLSKVNLEMIINGGGDFGRTRILQLIRSNDVEDRQYASELLLNSASDENTSLLIELLNDSESRVRNTAIKTASRKYNNEVLDSLIENLNNPQFSSQVMSTLTLIGTPALNSLEACFYRSGQSTQSLLKIIQVIGQIGNQRAKDILWNKVDFPDKVIVSQILLSLGKSGFKAGISQITRIKYAIESDIADIRWNLSALMEVGEADDIKNALEWENQNDIEHIYMLLAMLYDTNSIQLVKENIESGTTEGTTYAIELLDVFLSDQLKQRVIPVLDELTTTEKISRLEVYYPRVKLDEKLVLKFLINRDFTQTNRWTKATVIRQIGKKRIREFKLDLVAQLFNPDKLINEVAACSLYEIDQDEYHNNVIRLGGEKRRELDSVIIKGSASKLMRYEIVQFLSGISVFESLPGIALSSISDISEELQLKKGQSLILDEVTNQYFYLVYQGLVGYYLKGEPRKQFKVGEFIGEMVSDLGFRNSNRIVAQDDCTLLRLNKEFFYELISDNVKLADKILEFI